MSFLLVITISGVSQVVVAPQAAAANGSVTGRVFRDFNSNGTFDDGTATGAPAADIGLAGVAVTGYDGTGSAVATTSTNAQGRYTLTYSTATSGSQVRVEFTAPDRMVPTRAGVGGTSGGLIQFKSAGGTADLSLAYPEDFSEANPTLRMTRSFQVVDVSGTPIAQTGGTIVSDLYSHRGRGATYQTEATAAQTGVVLGVADYSDNIVLSSAGMRRYAAKGPGGYGAIYWTALGGSPDATVLTTIPNAGTDPRPANQSPASYDWYHDVDGYAAAGKIGLGGMALAPDRSAAYVVNLNTKQLVRVGLTDNGTAAPTVTGQQNFTIPQPSACAASRLRPFGVSRGLGSLWVTQTCTGPAASDLRGWVYRFDLATNTFDSAPALTVNLNYPRGPVFVPDGNHPGAWLPWSDVDDASYGSGLLSNPQPWLSAVQFDSNGDMNVAVDDRFRFQTGTGGRIGDPPGSQDYYLGTGGGQLLRACGNATSGWTLESNASCGSRTGARPNTGTGPGNGSFYDATVRDADDNNNLLHNYVTAGGLLQVPGFPRVVSTVYDPDSTVFTNGYRFFSNTNGGGDFSSANGDWRQIGTTSDLDFPPDTGFGKAGSMGQLDYLAEPPVEIGNRVWIDTDRDGIQDADEPGVAGVRVSLLRSDNTQLASVVTAADGSYYFNDQTVSGGVQPGVSYLVRLDRASDYASGGPLYRYRLTTANAGSRNAIDSDASTVNGYPQLTATSPTAGAGHNFDIGFAPTYSVGDSVWLDSDRDGVHDPGEDGIADIPVALRNSAGTVVAQTTTNSSGAYVFADVAPGTYTVAFTAPAGSQFTTASVGSAATDSNPGSNGVTAAFVVGPDAPNQRASTGADPVTTTFYNPTIDAGIFPTPSVSVGDFVWRDLNGNGLQDNGEPGIGGVRLRLTGPDGQPVTDRLGDPVESQLTASNGSYSFGGLPALPAGQHYTVTLDASTLPDGLVPTRAGVGTNRAVDSSTGTAESGDLTSDGDADLGLDFGFVPSSVSVGDFVWADRNGNGLQDNGEPGIGGVRLTLVGPDGDPVTDVFGNSVGAATTDDNGAYSFANLPTLPAGQHYTVRLDSSTLPDGLVPTRAGVGTNTGVDSSTGTAESGNLTSNGATDTSLDFGFVPSSVTVGDFVWRDLNGNGLQDNGEPGIAGVGLTLTGPGGQPVTDIYGNPVGTATTDTDGAYAFANLPTLPAGQHYTVALDPTTLPGGLVPTRAGVGTNRGADSSTGSAESGNLTSNGATDTSLDFGFVPSSVTVGDFVWRDLNGNGLQDNGEPGIGGVRLTLTGPDGDPVTTIFGNAVGAATTAGDGSYSFANLPVLPTGQHYTVTLDASSLPDGLVPTRAGVGTDRGADSSTGSAESGDLTTDGASDTGLDFGFVPSSVSVGDFVWRDLNGNGLQDNGEPGIGGVRLTLTGPDGDSVTDIYGNAVTAVTTDDNGAYSFVGLPTLPAGQHYTVALDASSLPDGLVPTRAGVGTNTNADSSTGSAESGNLTSNGASDTGLDFGFVPSSVTVGDFVWRDRNGNGLQDSGDPGIGGVRLTLTGPDGDPVTDIYGNPVDAATTDSDGSYSFTNLPVLPAGQHYTVVLDSSTLPDGLVPTRAGVGTNRAVDSSTGTAESGNLTTNGASDTGLDFGFVPSSVTVGDFVWRDLNGNGLQDNGEPGIGGVRLTLTGPDGDPVTDIYGNPVQAVTTDDNGAYSFVGLPTLPAGQHYTVALDASTLPDGLVPTRAGVGTDRGVDSSSDIAESGDLTTDGASDTSLDFGFIPSSVSVGDFVWRDLNGNGLQDNGDPGIGGVRLTLTGPDGDPVTDIFGNSVQPTTTNDDGGYTFTDLPVLPAGQHYTVTLDASTLPDGFVPTRSGIGTNTSVDSSTNSAESRNLTTDGASDTSLDFGFIPSSVTVGDFVWRDRNGNGLQDPGEPGIGGVRLRLTGPDGQPVTDIFGNPVQAVTTDDDGAYTFGDLPILPSGQHYTVVLDASTLPDGLVPTRAGVGTNTGIDSSTGAAESGDLTTNGASDTSLDFGFVPSSVSVGDFVWRDLNRDGLQDTGEPGIADIRLTLTGPDGDPVTDIYGNPVDAASTDANGGYSFANLPTLPGGQHYTVTLDASTLPDGLVPTRAGVGTDTGVDSSTGTAESGNLTTDGASDLSLDFGFVPSSVSVGDFVWRDLNGNGLQDSGDPGIGGVRLTLTGPDGDPVTDIDGNAVAAVLTDDNGGYVFVNLPVLPAGQHYTVTLDAATLPDGLVPTRAGVGTNRGADSSTGSAESGNLTTNGASDLSLDFGFVPNSVSVGDFVWVDRNGNGLQDSDDPGIADVRLRLTGPDGQPVTDIFGNPVQAITTDDDGGYTFGDLPVLPAGQHYTVVLDASTLPGGFVPTRAGVGTNRGVDSSTGSAESGDLTTDGASDTSLDFGFIPASVSVGNFVWIDRNRDGLQDTGEPGIADVRLTLTGPDGDPVTDIYGDPVAATTTDANGGYTFANLPILPAGQHYTVTLDASTLPAGLVPTRAGVGTDTGVDSSTGSAESGNLTTDGAADLSLDFGFVPASVSVGNYVWIDRNGNGLQNSGEPGIGDVRLTLTGPDGDPVTDVNGALVGPATTDADGGYLFADLPALPAGQHYTVTLDASTVPDGLVPTRSGVGSNTGVDSSTGSATSGDLTSDGSADLSLDFGFVPASVSVGNYVWRDTNRNGLQDDGEPGIGDVRLTLTGPDGDAVTDIFGNPVERATTDDDGGYGFANLPVLPAGQHYTVTLDSSTLPAGLIPTEAGAGSDTGVDSSTGTATSGDLTTDGAADLTLDFGFVAPTTPPTSPPPTAQPTSTTRPPTSTPTSNPTSSASPTGPLASTGLGGGVGLLGGLGLLTVLLGAGLLWRSRRRPSGGRTGDHQ